MVSWATLEVSSQIILVPPVPGTLEVQTASWIEERQVVNRDGWRTGVREGLQRSRLWHIGRTSDRFEYCHEV